MASTATAKHILLVNYPAFGHIIPNLELAKKLADHGFQVTFLVSAAKVTQMLERGMVPPNYKTKIILLPLDDEVLADQDKSPSPTLREHTSNCMKSALSKLFYNLPVSGRSLDSETNSGDEQLSQVDVVICDVFCPLPVSICHERRIPCHLFNNPSAAALDTMLEITEDAPTLSESQFYAVVDPNKLSTQTGGRQLTESNKRFMLSCNNAIPLAKSIILNTFLDLEKETLAHMKGNSKCQGVATYTVAPMLPESPKMSSAQALSANMVERWLNFQKPKSVVYVACGSMAVPLPEQTLQMGLGLLALGMPFIWSLAENQKVNLPEPLQLGLEKQIGGRNDTPFLILPWTPQQAILAHSSVQVFITSCGWNSAMEAIFWGVPLVLCPLFGDQFISAKILESLGIGVRVPGTGLKAVVPAAEITKAVTAVTQNSAFYGTAQIWAGKAKEAITENGSSTREFTEIVKMLSHAQ